MKIIQTKKMTKTFHSGDSLLVALNEIDLEINQGETIALTGPSGAGKTTLMHLLGCLDTPSSGLYLLNDQNVSSLSRHELAKVRNQQIGFVFQNFHLLNDFNALENVVLPQIYGGVKEKLARQKAQELLDLVGLSQRCFHYPHQLSGGQKQRVAIARALAMNPKILLADEPTGNLDSENAKMIIELFLEINRLKQTTIIMVTHEKQIANQMRRCVTIRDGLIASDILQETIHV